MPFPFLDTDFASWSPDGQSFRIDFALPVLEEICALAVDGLARVRHGGIEVGGVLFGEAGGDVVRILAFRPLECEHAFGPRFVLSERDRSQLRHLLSAPAHDPGLSGLVPVGWYHSHTRSQIALSPRDLEVYDSFFPERWQVALVVRPDDDGPVRAGFFFREPEALIRTASSYAEFELAPRYHGLAPEPPAEEAEPSREREQPVAPEPPPAEPIPEPEALGEPAPASAPAERIEEIPQFVQVQPPRPARRGVWIVLALILAGAAGFGVERYYRLRASPQALSLWVADMGGQLLIEWDRSAKPVRDASSGILEIQDGPERVEHIIQGDRLREGSVDYVRRSEIVDVRLRVRSRGATTEESIRFIGPPVERPAGATELVRQRDELKAEVDKLRLQLHEREKQIKRYRAQPGGGAEAPPHNTPPR